jgi:hypothetical protein
MRSTTLLFYGSDALAATGRSAELRKQGEIVMVTAASAFMGQESCTRVEIMPDVHGWQRDRIIEAFGDRVSWPLVKRYPGESSALTFKHRGRGRFFVMRGEEIVSGPHTREEAEALVG